MTNGAPANGKHDLWRWVFGIVFSLIVFLAGRVLSNVDERLDLVEHRQFEAQNRLSIVEAQLAVLTGHKDQK